MVCAILRDLNGCMGIGFPNPSVNTIAKQLYDCTPFPLAV